MTTGVPSGTAKDICTTEVGHKYMGETWAGQGQALVWLRRRQLWHMRNNQCLCRSHAGTASVYEAQVGLDLAVGAAYLGAAA